MERRRRNVGEKEAPETKHRVVALHFPADEGPVRAITKRARQGKEKRRERVRPKIQDAAGKTDYKQAQRSRTGAVKKKESPRGRTRARDS